jgi:hypothetical protein
MKIFLIPIEVLIIVFLLNSVNIYAQTPDELKHYFQLASTEFDVPQPILESIAYVQTKWTQILIH